MDKIKGAELAQTAYLRVYERSGLDFDSLAETIGRLPPQSLVMMAGFMQTACREPDIIDLTFDRKRDVLKYLVNMWNEQNLKAPDGAWFGLPLQIDGKKPDRYLCGMNEYRERPDVIIYDFFYQIKDLVPLINPSFPQLTFLGVSDYLLKVAQELPAWSGELNLNGILINRLDV